MARKFLGVWIPAHLWLRRDITVGEKMLYLEIQSLDNDFGCIASNKKLGETIQLTPTSVSRCLKTLEDKELIKITYEDYVSFSGRKIVVTPCENDKGVCRNDKAPCENDKHSNTNSNTNSNYSSDNSSELSVYQRCVEFWLKEFKDKDYQFTAVSGKSLKNILSKLKKLIKGTRGENFSDDDVVSLFKKMCTSMPDFYQDKDLQQINGGFNTIVQHIKSIQNGQSNTIKQRGQSVFRTN